MVWGQIFKNWNLDIFVLWDWILKLTSVLNDFLLYCFGTERGNRSLLPSIVSDFTPYLHWHQGTWGFSFLLGGDASSSFLHGLHWYYGEWGLITAGQWWKCKLSTRPPLTQPCRKAEACLFSARWEWIPGSLLTPGRDRTHYWLVEGQLVVSYLAFSGTTLAGVLAQVLSPL